MLSPFLFGVGEGTCLGSAPRSVLHEKELLSDYCFTLRCRSLYFACVAGVLSQDKNSFCKIVVHYAPCYFGVPLRFSLRKIL